MANTFFSFDILAFVFWGFEIEKVKFVSIYLKSLREIVHSFFSSSVFFSGNNILFLCKEFHCLYSLPISNKVCNNFLSKGFMKWPFFCFCCPDSQTRQTNYLERFSIIFVLGYFRSQQKFNEFNNS